MSISCSLTPPPPPDYCAAFCTPSVPQSSYLLTVGGALLPAIDVLWTGKELIHSFIRTPGTHSHSLIHTDPRYSLSLTHSYGPPVLTTPSLLWAPGPQVLRWCPTSSPWSPSTR